MKKYTAKNLLAALMSGFIIICWQFFMWGERNPDWISYEYIFSYPEETFRNDRFEPLYWLLMYFLKLADSDIDYIGFRIIVSGIIILGFFLQFTGRLSVSNNNYILPILITAFTIFSIRGIIQVREGLAYIFILVFLIVKTTRAKSVCALTSCGFHNGVLLFFVIEFLMNILQKISKKFRVVVVAFGLIVFVFMFADFFSDISINNVVDELNYGVRKSNDGAFNEVSIIYWGLVGFFCIYIFNELKKTTCNDLLCNKNGLILYCGLSFLFVVIFKLLGISPAVTVSFTRSLNIAISLICLQITRSDSSFVSKLLISLFYFFITIQQVADLVLYTDKF